VNGDRLELVFIREEGSWEKWSGPIRGEGWGRSSESQEGMCLWWGGGVSKSYEPLESLT
jgi:hypothetical protein